MRVRLSVMLAMSLTCLLYCLHSLRVDVTRSILSAASNTIVSTTTASSSQRQSVVDHESRPAETTTDRCDYYSGRLSRSGRQLVQDALRQMKFRRQSDVYVSDLTSLSPAVTDNQPLPLPGPVDAVERSEQSVTSSDSHTSPQLNQIPRIVHQTSDDVTVPMQVRCLSVSMSVIDTTRYIYRRYGTIRCGRLTCAQKLTRWSA